MTSSSLAFYGWLTGAVVLYRLIPAKWRAVALVAISCLFCGATSPKALVLLTGATAVAFFAGLRLADERAEARRARTLYVAIALLVGLLVVFKAAGAIAGVWIPLGLSYYTFKLTSYLIETWWDPSYVQRSVVSLAAYSAFGAQLLSGPIQRPASFFEQLSKTSSRALDDADFERGFRLILYGLLLKLVIGDRLGAFTALVAKDPGAYTRPVLVAGAFSYLPQLYADFAGYTNIALGIGLLFGIEGPPNFDRPFAAPNLQEFWRRWHMSLTNWLTDYVFTPLRMATRNWGKVGLVASVLVNMTLIGVWHGFSWCFLAFGIVQGVFLSTSVLTLKQRARFFDRWRWLSPPRMLLGILGVQVLQAIAQVFFQAPSIASAWVFLRVVVGLKAGGSAAFSDIRTDIVDPLPFCWPLAFYAGLGMPGTKGLRDALTRWMPNWIRYGVCLLAIAALTSEEGGKFIYGQF